VVSFEAGGLRILHLFPEPFSGYTSVLAGDYNVVPTDADIYAMRSWKTNALVQPEPRAAYARLQESGWTDALALLNPAGAPYTFWHYLRNSWARDAGMRLDHLLLSPALVSRLQRSGVDRDVRGVSNASDHAPAWIEIKS